MDKKRVKALTKSTLGPAYKTMLKFLKALRSAFRHSAIEQQLDEKPKDEQGGQDN